MPTVLIADNDPVMRMMLTAIVSADPELTLVGAAADTDEAIALSAQHAPDVVMDDAGADGYVVKGAPPDVVAQALRGET